MFYLFYWFNSSIKIENKYKISKEFKEKDEEIQNLINKHNDEKKSLISQFPNKTPEEVCELFFGIGLSSIPTLLRKPHELSNGEKDRFELAWKIGNVKDGSVIYVDEFTSVVNRDVAKSMSFALQRYVRQHNLKIVLASCHFDLIEWLQPDWIFNLNKQDSNGDAELERMIYSDDKEYVAYNKINENEILSDERSIN